MRQMFARDAENGAGRIIDIARALPVESKSMG
jgi:hypothetical protein